MICTVANSWYNKGIKKRRYIRMKQQTISDVEYSVRKRKTKREEFLEILDEIISWEEWVEYIKLYYPSGKRGRHPEGIEMMSIYSVGMPFVPYIGKVGRDAFGDPLEGTLAEVGIDTAGLKRDDGVHATLAFVHTHADGERDFSFYRNPGADMNLTVGDLNGELLDNCRIFHFGSLSLRHPACREATQAAVARARKAGALLSFDPNLREPLWANLGDAREQIAWGLAQCDILKISDNELEFMTGTKDFGKSVDILRARHPQIRLLNVTAGDDGSICYYGSVRHHVPKMKGGSCARKDRRRGYPLCLHPELRAGAWCGWPDRGSAT